MFKSTLRSICITIALIGAMALTSPGKAEKWSFGVMSDTQQTISGGTNSVATSIIAELNKQFIAAGVHFVVQVGDLTNDGVGSLQTRLDANKPLTDAGIAFFGLRGNHDDYENQTRPFMSFFRDNYIPGTAGYSANSVDLPGLSVSVMPGTVNYSVTYNGTKLVLWDILAGKGTNATMDAATTWVNNDLASSEYEHAFFFSHKNFAGQNHKDTIFGNDTASNGWTANPTQQNNLYAALANNGVRYVMSGHDHMHYRALLESPNGQHTLNQLICGSDSTKFYYPVNGYSNRETPLAQQLGMITYYIFTVNGDQVTVDAYATSHQGNATSNDGDIVANPTWVRVETFGYSNSGTSFLVAGGANFNETNTSSFMDTTMTISGKNTSLTAMAGSQTSPQAGRPLSREINIGWMAGGEGFASDILTIWGMEDISGTYANAHAVPTAPTALEFSLTLSFNPTLYTDVYMQCQDLNDDWHIVDGFTVDYVAGTVSALVSPGGMGVFALGGTAVPEPATMTFLALSGLALLRRRRK